RPILRGRIGGHQHPAGVSAGGDAAEVGREPVPADEGPGDDRLPVRLVTIPQQDLFLPVRQAGAGDGGAVGRVGGAGVVDLGAAGGLVDQDLAAVGVEGKIAVGGVAHHGPDVGEGIAVVEPGPLVVGPLDDDILPRGVYADPVGAPGVRPRGHDAFFDE